MSTSKSTKQRAVRRLEKHTPQLNIEKNLQLKVYEGQKDLCAERVEKQALAPGSHTGRLIPVTFSFKNQRGWIQWVYKTSGPGDLKVCWLSIGQARRVSDSWVVAFKEKEAWEARQQQQPQKQQFAKCRGQMGDKFVHTDFEACWGTSLKMKELIGAIFLPCSPA